MSAEHQPKRNQRSERPATRVGEWVLYPDLSVVRRGEVEVRLNAKSLEVLLVLIDAGSRGVARGALLDSVWGASYPSDAVVSRAIADLRAAFGEKAGEQRYIRTLPKYGYQLVAAVQPFTEVVADCPGPADAQPLANGRSARADSADPRSWYWFAGAAVLALLIVALAFAPWDEPPAGLPSKALFEADKPLTADTGLEHQPRFAPDAQWVVYASKAHGQDDWDLYRTHLADGTRLPVATDPRVSEHGPAYAPDGRQLAYVRFDARGCDVVIDDLLQGAAQPIARCSTRFPTLVDWASDGRRLAYSNRAADDPLRRRRIYEFDLDTRASRPLTDAVSATGTDFYPRYSPSGRQLAFLRGEPQPDHRSTLWVVDLASGTERQVQAPAAQLGGMSWQDENHLLYVINEFGSWTLYRLGITSGEQRRLRAPELIHPEVHAGIGALVATTVKRRVGLLRLDARRSAEAGGGLAAVSLALSTADDYAGRLSPDGRTLAFVSTRSGHAELWVADLSGSSERQLTRFEGPPVRSADWHQSGDSLLFTVATDRGERLHQVRLITGQIQPLGPQLAVAAPRWLDEGERWVADCQIDGRWQICMGAEGLRSLDVRLFHPQPIGPEIVAAVDDRGALLALNLVDGSTTAIWDGLPGRGRYGWEVAQGTLYYLREAGINGQGQLIGRDLDSGFESVLFQGDLPLADTIIDVNAESGAIVLTSFQAASDDLQLFRMTLPQ